MYLICCRVGWSMQQAFCHASCFHMMGLRCTWRLGIQWEQRPGGCWFAFHERKLSQSGPLWVERSTAPGNWLGMHAPHTTWAGARGGPVVHIFARLRVMPRPWKIRNTIQRLRLYSECWVSSPPARASGGLWGPTNNMGFFCDFQRELKTLKIYGSPRIFVWERERRTHK